MSKDFPISYKNLFLNNILRILCSVKCFNKNHISKTYVLILFYEKHFAFVIVLNVIFARFMGQTI